MFPIARISCVLLCLAFLSCVPAAAFTADSLAITVKANGDATADFHFTLQGVIENAIPVSVLQDQVTRGLATSNEPPQVLSFSTSEAVLLLKDFADTSAVPTGTEYRTASMNFTNAQAALRNSAVSSVISADFTPRITTVTFPDGYSREFDDSSLLPGIDHIVVNPAQAGSASAAGSTGAIEVNSSPEHVQVFIDSVYAGDSPYTFTGISPGVHQVRLEADNFLPFSGNVTVTAGQTARVVESLELAAPPTPRSPAPGAGEVLGVLVMALGCFAFLRRR
ncbi:PEGA domain-containing protein [Methanoregula sp.]|uniref:PEGA domain-containing protein n=1 Tax=Methanoregula sp. TaxID=2052170 RepID=UPI002C823AA9|nr:PEGA domain-containing protein [Methanoregula sp.]HVP95865.1 PEGA domain-containing protein [Methanoregula sp.]